MTDTELSALLASVCPADEAARQAAVKRLDALAKPPGSLGALEDIAAQIAAVTRSCETRLTKSCVLVFAADNGVVDEGVASGPQSLTAQQSINMLRGLTGVAVLARRAGAQVWVTDVGVNAQLEHPAMRHAKIAHGTNNIAKGSAMARAQALQAIQTGFSTACEAAEAGCKVLGIGEMGIGNTTTSSAVLCGLLGLRGNEVQQTVGRGAGLVDEAFRKKVSVVERALAVNNPDSADPVDVLAKVGGFDLAAMTGAFLGAAARRVPVVIDGFISVVAALCAARLCPAAKDAFFASHLSHERGYTLALDALGLRAYLQLDMRLGEGSGCPLMFTIMDSACAVLCEMATFEQVQINTDYLNNISKETSF